MRQTLCRKTRLCFVIDKLALRSGGAERVLIETANALYDHGYAVEIVTHEARGKRPFYPLRKGIILSNIRPCDHNRSRVWRAMRRVRSMLHRNRFFIPGLSHLQWWSQNGSFRRRLAAHIDATAPDVAIAFLPPAVTALGHAHFSHQTRRFASLHNVPEQDFDNPGRWDPNPVDRKLRRAALAHFDGIGILLPEFRDWFDDELQERLIVMPNAVHPVDPACLSAAKRKKRVISVGRLADVKQHRLLIEAWSHLKDDFPDWICEIYGVGPLESALKEQIEQLQLDETVILRGATNAIEKEYLSAKILAHPAEFEGFGLVITEALAHGLPVVGFEDCSGFNFIVHEQVSGLFVSAAGDRAKNLSGSLAKLMRDPALCTALGDAGLKEIERFSPQSILALWEQAIQGTDQRLVLEA